MVFMLYRRWRCLMKLGNFFLKDPPSRSSVNKTITVGNEAKENELLSTIAVLQTEIGRFPSIEKENSTLRDRVQKAETSSNEAAGREQELIQTNKLLQLSANDGEIARSDNQRLIQDVTELTHQVKSKDGTLEHATKNNLTLTTTVEALTTDIKSIQEERTLLKIQLDESLQQTSTSLEHFNNMQAKLDDTNKLFQGIEVKYIEGQRRNIALSNDVRYWTYVAKNLQEEQEGLEQTHKTLKGLLQQMETEYVETSGRVRINAVELGKLRGTVRSMTTSIDQLVQENKDLSSFNSVLKNELARPKYMSMAAINRSEGFKLPTGGYRKHFLGNSKPTLLKFKREDNHDE